MVRGNYTLSCKFRAQLIRSVQVAQVRAVASKIPPISTITKSHTDTEPKIADCICRSRMFDAAVESRGWGPMKSPVPPDSILPPESSLHAYNIRESGVLTMITGRGNARHHVQWSCG